MMKAKLDYDYCPAAPVLEWMSRKWALVTLLHMKEVCAATGEAGIRFGDLYRTIPHVSEKMLAATLDYLEDEALVDRHSNGGIPPCVTYSLTPLALDFLREIGYVVEWGQLHFSQIMHEREERLCSRRMLHYPK